MYWAAMAAGNLRLLPKAMKSLPFFHSMTSFQADPALVT